MHSQMVERVVTAVEQSFCYRAEVNTRAINLLSVSFKFVQISKESLLIYCCHSRSRLKVKKVYILFKLRTRHGMGNRLNFQFP